MAEHIAEHPDFEADLQTFERFRDWLQSLVAAQQPLDEWSLSLEQLQQRWLPRLEQQGDRNGRLFF